MAARGWRSSHGFCTHPRVTLGRVIVAYVEIESKFRIHDEQTFQRLLTIPALGDYALGPVEHVEVLDRYYDTEDAALLRGGYACRLRRERDQTLVTVKGLGGATDGIHRRQEMEVIVSGEADPQTWPSCEARALVLRKVGDRSLSLLFELHQHRSRRRVRRGGREVGLLSLDRVTARACGRTLAWRELEIELDPTGELSDLERLREQLQQTFGLYPEPESKFARVWRWYCEMKGRGR